MTLIEAINAIDALKPNNYTQSEKRRWLSSLDCAVFSEIITAHEGAETLSFSGYDDETPPETVLIAGKEPFGAELYVRYLENQIDYYNGETEKYNNSLLALQAAYTAFARHYNRTHLPKGRKRKFW